MNRDVYFPKFGYKGHNGVDLRLHQGNDTPVYAPHDGVVKERRLDEDGYGYYLKIESEIEGSILAHLKEFRVNINQKVEEGQLVAIGDNTGWSTGSHLHWGYYRIPRDRKNGYGGTIDPRPYLGVNSVYYKGIDLNNHESVKVCIDTWKEVVDGLYIKKEVLAKAQEEFKTEKEALNVRIKKEKERYKDFVADLAQELNCTQEEPAILEEIIRAIACEDKVTELERRLTDQGRVVKTHEETIEALRQELATLRKHKIDNYSGWQLIAKGLAKLLRRKK